MRVRKSDGKYVGEMNLSLEIVGEVNEDGLSITVIYFFNFQLIGLKWQINWLIWLK